MSQAAVELPEVLPFMAVDSPACLLAVAQEEQGNGSEEQVLEGYKGKCGCTCLCPST